MATSLPPNWDEYTAPDGQCYYHNRITNVTQWDRPAPPSRVPVAPAPAAPPPPLKTAVLNSPVNVSAPVSTSPVVPPGRSALMNAIRARPELKSSGPTADAAKPATQASSKVGPSTSSSGSAGGHQSALQAAIAARLARVGGGSATEKPNSLHKPISPASAAGHTPGTSTTSAKPFSAVASTKPSRAPPSPCLRIPSHPINRDTATNNALPTCKSPRQTSTASSAPIASPLPSDAARLEARLAAVEHKLDLLLQHFNIRA